MKDSDLRGLVLKRFYERRREITPKWAERHVPEGIEPRDFFLICNQLRDQNLINWKPYEELQNQLLGGTGTITAFGVDVVEGTQRSPITINFDQSRTVNINGSNNIVGDHNTFNLEAINAAINGSEYSSVEKADAKSLWQKVSENKLLNAVLGAVCGAATKHAIETQD